MGMDVYGKNPTDKTGEYFRNNIWWWRELWNYCTQVAPVACLVVNGQTNDGDGLAESGALKLAEALQEAIDSGDCRRHADTYNSRLARLSDLECEYCHGTGTRKDMVVANGCNACSGKGTVRPFETHYQFSEENVRNFVAFLRTCGGFEIN